MRQTILIPKVPMEKHPRESTKKLVFLAKWAVLVILAIVAFASIYQKDLPRNADEPLMPLNGVIDEVLGGAGRKQLALRNDNGIVLASCRRVDCGYPEMDADKGKPAVFWVQGTQVFKIEVGGMVRVSEETIITRRDGHKLLPVFIVVISIILGVALATF
jgi:hypothetical protein